MNKILLIIISIVIASCSPRLVEVERIEYVEKEVLRDTTIFVQIEGQIQRNRVKDTLSYLENKWAKSTASIDSLGYLNHSLEEKRQDLPLRIVYKDKLLKKDSIIIKPYPVKGDTIIKEVVPDWCWWLLAIFAVQLAYVVFRIYLKFKKPL